MVHSGYLFPDIKSASLAIFHKIISAAITGIEDRDPGGLKKGKVVI
jgi:hypothetical protein